MTKTPMTLRGAELLREELRRRKSEDRPRIIAAVDEALVGEKSVDLVLSDMAPNISGIDVADQASSLYLCELALEFAKAHLKAGGVFVCKVFQGEGFDEYLKAVRAVFKSVAIRKPKASRPRSREVYLVAKNFSAV